MVGEPPVEHDPEKLQTFRTKIMLKVKDDPEKLQTFRTKIMLKR
jgi:hypothetical protein